MGQGLDSNYRRTYYPQARQVDAGPVDPQPQDEHEPSPYSSVRPKSYGYQAAYGFSYPVVPQIGYGGGFFMANGGNSGYPVVYGYPPMNGTYMHLKGYNETKYETTTTSTTEAPTTTTKETYASHDSVYSDPVDTSYDPYSSGNSYHYKGYKGAKGLLHGLKGNYHGRIDASNVVVNIVKPAFLPGQSEAESLDALASTLEVLSNPGYASSEQRVTQQIGQSLLDLINGRPELAEVILGSLTNGSASKGPYTTTVATQATTTQATTTVEIETTTISENSTVTDAGSTTDSGETTTSPNVRRLRLNGRFSDIYANDAPRREGKNVAEGRNLEIEPMQSYPMTVMSMV